jgi:hypothetical protein
LRPRRRIRPTAAQLVIKCSDMGNVLLGIVLQWLKESPLEEQATNLLLGAFESEERLSALGTPRWPSRRPGRCRQRAGLALLVDLVEGPVGGGAGRQSVLGRQTARSLSASGSSYTSTIATVCPFPDAATASVRL